MNDHWTAAQLRALKQLERAFATAKRAGIAICGMDDSLLAYRARELDREYRSNGMNLYEAQNELCNHRDGEVHSLDDHGIYRDSGGW